jgi:hypothetical protein
LATRETKAEKAARLAEARLDSLRRAGFAPTADEVEEAERLREAATRSRRRANNARARSSVLRDLGLVKTPYGWE